MERIDYPSAEERVRISVKEMRNERFTHDDVISVMKKHWRRSAPSGRSVGKYLLRLKEVRRIESFCGPNGRKKAQYEKVEA